jgi:hypothetical protein
VARADVVERPREMSELGRAANERPQGRRLDTAWCDVARLRSVPLEAGKDVDPRRAQTKGGVKANGRGSFCT